MDRDKMNNASEQLISVLEEVKDILLVSSNYGQADYVMQLILFLEDNRLEEFASAICTLEMWGGSGAVWEVGGFTSTDQESRFRKLIIKTIEFMEDVDVKCKAATSTKKSFLSMNKQS